jgi:DNA invertase Pin-like site-specific DNA recombinase
MPRRAALYARVSTRNGQTPENQIQALCEVASRKGWGIVDQHVEHRVSGAKGGDKRPEFDRLLKDATRRKFDVLMAWSTDRLGCSLQDLVSFLGEISKHVASVISFRIGIVALKCFLLLEERAQRRRSVAGLDGQLVPWTR